MVFGEPDRLQNEDKVTRTGRVRNQLYRQILQIGLHNILHNRDLYKIEVNFEK
jgi:hypothetical protein